MKPTHLIPSLSTPFFKSIKGPRFGLAGGTLMVLLNDNIPFPHSTKPPFLFFDITRKNDDQITFDSGLFATLHYITNDLLFLSFFDNTFLLAQQINDTQALVFPQAFQFSQAVTHLPKTNLPKNKKFIETTEKLLRKTKNYPLKGKNAFIAPWQSYNTTPSHYPQWSVALEYLFKIYPFDTQDKPFNIKSICLYQNRKYPTYTLPKNTTRLRQILNEILTHPLITPNLQSFYAQNAYWNGINWIVKSIPLFTWTHNTVTMSAHQKLHIQSIVHQILSEKM